MGGDHDSDFQLLMTFDGAATDDRSLAIVFTSYAEKYLATVIQHRMKGLTTKLREKLFKPDGLLGPLQAKIDVAMALNLLEPEMFDDLKAMASIRNQFAHNLDITSFNHPEIAKRVANLKLTPERYPERINPPEAWMERDWSNRNRFRLSARAICATLHWGAGGIARLSKHGAKD